MKKNNNSKKRLVNGSYSAVLTVIVTAVIIFVNMIVQQLPAQKTQPDFSTSRLYTLTETTKEYLSGLSEEVTLYLICEGGEEDDTITKLLRRYEDASEYVDTEQVDPAIYPGFTSRYTEEKVSNNSVIVASEKKSKVIRYEDMYQIGTSAATGRYVETGFDGEGLVTSAIGYVVSEELPVLYLLDANGERSLGESYLHAISGNNITVEDLNLLSEEIPENAAGLLIAAPQKDYSEEEAQKIIAYLENGGKAVILSDYSENPMPNFDAILSDYGLKRGEGIILEGASDHFVSYQYCLLPEIQYSNITAKVYKDSYILTPMSQRILTTETYRQSISMSPLLTTTENSYNKADVVNMKTSEKESQDESGPFTVGMLVQEDINNDQEVDTEIVYYSTGYLLDEDYNATVSGTNAVLLGDTVNALLGNHAESIAIPTKNMQVKYLGITDFAANFWTAICVFVLPAVCVLWGIVVWLRRRKR